MEDTIKKGSFTVEAACVMPVILLVLMGTLYLNFYIHNRAWLTAAAYEASVSGTMLRDADESVMYETAQRKGEALVNTGFFCAENITVQTSVGKKIRVTYDLDTFFGFAGMKWHMRTAGESQILCPAKWVRKAKAAAEVLNEIGD
ncbi:MAG: TadE family protein [Blautia sp.]|nr:TadE family protein [Blautia sp.]